MTEILLLLFSNDTFDALQHYSKSWSLNCIIGTLTYVVFTKTHTFIFWIKSACREEDLTINSALSFENLISFIRSSIQYTNLSTLSHLYHLYRSFLLYYIIGVIIIVIAWGRNMWWGVEWCWLSMFGNSFTGRAKSFCHLQSWLARCWLNCISGHWLYF